MANNSAPVTPPPPQPPSAPAPTPTPTPLPTPSPTPEVVLPDPGPTPIPRPTPDPVPPQGKFGRLSPTIYYKPIVHVDPEKCVGEDLVPLLSVDGKELTLLCPKDFSNCLMQGACYVRDLEERFRSFTYIRRGEDGSPRFGEINLARCPFGVGVRNVCLDPFYSVAADLSLYKLGDVIFVPRLQGQLMPDGLIHDGFLVIRDAGGAIKGPSRFDFFTGFIRPYVPENIFRKLGFSDIRSLFLYRMATPEEADLIRQRTGYPGLKNNVIIPPQAD